MSLLYPDLGDVCFAPGCGRYDFLASKCRLCKSVTCSEHIAPESHNCSAAKRVVCNKCSAVVVCTGIEEMMKIHSCAQGPRHEGAKCDRLDCAAYETFLISCIECNKKHCIEHRLPEDHSCPGLRDPEGGPKGPARQAPLTSSDATLPFHKWGYANTMAEIEFNGVEKDQRFGLRVYFSQTASSGARPRYVCVNKRWTMGRVLDHCCAQASVPNRNNLATTPKEERLRVFLLWGACAELEPQKTIEQFLAERREFRMGVGVMIHNSDALPAAVVNAVPRWVMSLRLKDMSHAGTMRSFLNPLTWNEELDRREATLFRRAAKAWCRMDKELRALIVYLFLLALIGWADPG